MKMMKTGCTLGFLWPLVLIGLVAIPHVAWPRDAQRGRLFLPASAEDLNRLPGKSPGIAGVRNTPIVLLGIVVAVDPFRGDLALGHGDGTRSHLDADPLLLRNIQVGDPVKVVVEGSTVRTVEELGAPSPRA